MFWGTNFHRGKNQNRKACGQPICLVQDSEERAFIELTHGLYFLFTRRSIAKLWPLLCPRVNRPESLFTGTLRTTLDPPMGMRVSISLRLHPAMHTHLVYTLYNFLPYIENEQNTQISTKHSGGSRI